MRIVAVTHGPNVGPGVLAEPVRQAGHDLVEWNAPGGGEPPEADAMIVLGGAMPPDDDEQHPWLAREQELLAGALERGTPLLCICLGAQLLARAAGARMVRAREPEIGWIPVELTEAGAADPVIGALPRRFDAFEWHSYTFELPGDAVELARSDVCTQAYRLERAWGMQFHPEIMEPQVSQWLGMAGDDVADPDSLLAATRSNIGGWNGLGRDLARAWLDTLE